jgi:hypothetical protein
MIVVTIWRPPHVRPQQEVRSLRISAGGSQRATQRPCPAARCRYLGTPRCPSRDRPTRRPLGVLRPLRGAFGSRLCSAVFRRKIGFQMLLQRHPREHLVEDRQGAGRLAGAEKRRAIGGRGEGRRGPFVPGQNWRKHEWTARPKASSFLLSTQAADGVAIVFRGFSNVARLSLGRN